MIDLGRGVKLITRKEWGARPPRSTSPLNPTYGTTAHWEGPHIGWPWSHGACFSLVRGIQAFHMDSRGWADIAYTACPCPHGYVFEGRWIGKRTAANGTTDGNNRAYAVCYLGGEGDLFTDAGKQAMRAVMDHLDAHGGAGPGRNCHRDWKATACPGDVICGWVRAGMPVTGPPPPQEDDMDIEDLRRELTTSGTPTRTAIRELARMGARDAITTAGDPTRGAVRALVQRGVADALGYFGQREGQGEVMFVLAGCVRVPIGPATREWCDTLRAVAGDKPANVVAVPGDAWDEMPVLGDI